MADGEKVLQDNEQSALVIEACPCSNPECRAIMFAIVRPELKPVTGSDAMAAVAFFPVDGVQGLIDRLRALAAIKGLDI